jgi:hypothetical protein
MIKSVNSLGHLSKPSMLEIHVSLFNSDPNRGAETAFDLAGRVYNAVPVSATSG